MSKFNIKKFFTEVKEELQRVNWPTRQDTIGTSLVVLVVVGLITLYLGVVDIIVSRLTALIIG